MMRAFSRHKSTNGNALCELLLIVQEQHRKALAARCEHLYIKRGIRSRESTVNADFTESSLYI